MKLHANAALSLSQRRRLVCRVLEEGCDRTAAKWVARHRAEGEAGLLDRSSAPAVVANRTDERRVEAIAALRRLRFTGPELAELLDMPLSTVSGVLTRIGMGKLGRLGLEPVQRYERARPGSTTSTSRNSDASRAVPASASSAGNASTTRRSPTARAGVGRPSAGTTSRSPSTTPPGWPTPRSCATRGHHRRRVPAPAAALLSPSWHHRRARPDRQRLALRLSDPRGRLPRAGHPPPADRPRRPQTNGKAERFIRTMLGGWAYGAIYASSTERTGALDGWLWHYNHRRRHSALSHETPATRLNNLLGTYA